MKQQSCFAGNQTGNKKNFTIIFWCQGQTQNLAKNLSLSSLHLYLSHEFHPQWHEKSHVDRFQVFLKGHLKENQNSENKVKEKCKNVFFFHRLKFNLIDLNLYLIF